MAPDIEPGIPVRDTDDDDDAVLFVTEVLDETAAEHIVDYTWDAKPKYLHGYDEANEQYPADSRVVKAVYRDQMQKKGYSFEDDVETIREGPFKAYPFPVPRLEPL